MDQGFNSPNNDPMITLPYPYNFSGGATTSSGSSGEISHATSPPPSQTMDSRVWSKLPQRLLDRVVSALPAPAFFRARCVCKRWYALLFSAAFLELHLEHRHRRSHCFLFFLRRGNAEPYLFDPQELTWHRLAPPPLSATSFSPAAASGGLVCYVSSEAGPKSLILHNPITNSLTQLPPAPTPRLFPSVGLSVTPTTLHVTVAGDDLISPYAVKNLTSESFHVDARGFYSAWGRTSQLPRLSSLESGRVIHVSGRFYAMNYSPFSVVAQDAASDEWWKIQAPMRRFLRSPSLVEIQGKLVLVAAVEKSQLNVPKSLRMWGLQACGGVWVETERMPQQLYAQFEEAEAGNGFSCVGHGDFLVILIRRSSSSSRRALLFHVATKAWLWMPQCPYDSFAHGELHAFAYEPHLATPVTALLDPLTPFNQYSA